jgi:deoxyribose-phosphate aldolase
MKQNEAARFIDISAVRTAHTFGDIVNIVKVAKQYRFINVHCLPCWVSITRELLSGEEDIFVGSPVGFPGGGHKTEVKLLEAEHLIKDGVQEMDIVMNVGRFKNHEYGYVLDELKQIIRITPKTVRTKVIIEINVLTDTEMNEACELVMQSGAEFIKTGTGWIPGPVNIKRIEKMRELTRGEIKLKAAGGIRTRDEFETLLGIGVDRFGINLVSALEIVSSYARS